MTFITIWQNLTISNESQQTCFMKFIIFNFAEINNKIYKIWIFSVACCYNSCPIKTLFAFHSPHQNGYNSFFIVSIFSRNAQYKYKATAFQHNTWTEFSYSALVIQRYNLCRKNEEINLLYRKWPISSECPTKNMKPVSLWEKLSHIAM